MWVTVKYVDLQKEALILQFLTGAVQDQPIQGHIVKFVDFFSTPSHHFLVTEHIDGMNLKDFVHEAHEYIDNGRLYRPEWARTVKEIMWMITATIHWLHNVCHCMYNVNCNNVVKSISILPLLHMICTSFELEWFEMLHPCRNTVLAI